MSNKQSYDFELDSGTKVFIDPAINGKMIFTLTDGKGNGDSFTYPPEDIPTEEEGGNSSHNYNRQDRKNAIAKYLQIISNK